MIAIDSAPIPRSPTRSSIDRSCSQVIHEIAVAGYEMINEIGHIDVTGPIVFVFRHHAKQ